MPNTSYSAVPQFIVRCRAKQAVHVAQRKEITSVLVWMVSTMTDGQEAEELNTATSFSQGQNNNMYYLE